MNALVPRQVPGVLEALVALLAGVGPLASVNALVTCYIGRAREAFSTLGARVDPGGCHFCFSVDGKRLGELDPLESLPW